MIVIVMLFRGEHKRETPFQFNLQKNVQDLMSSKGEDCLKRNVRYPTLPLLNSV